MANDARCQLTARLIGSMQEIELQEQLTACKRKIAELEQRLADDEARVKQSSEDLKQFAYVASHDFREPLRAIVSYTQLIELRYGKQLDASAHEFMKHVVNSAHHMNALVDGLMSYSRVSSVEPLANGRVSLEGVLAGVKLKLDEQIRGSGATIEHGELPQVQGEEQSLDRLFYELIANALLYRGEQAPKVQISANETGEFWEFTVTDNGVGIDQAYHDRIFGLFKRLHGRNIPGIGLGLAICRKIVERHGGSIGVESQAGHGTTFRFTLPA